MFYRHNLWRSTVLYSTIWWHPSAHFSTVKISDLFSLGSSWTRSSLSSLSPAPSRHEGEIWARRAAGPSVSPAPCRGRMKNYTHPATFHICLMNVIHFLLVFRFCKNAGTNSLCHSHKGFVDVESGLGTGLQENDSILLPKPCLKSLNVNEALNFVCIYIYIHFSLHVFHDCVSWYKCSWSEMKHWNRWSRMNDSTHSGELLSVLTSDHSGAGHVRLKRHTYSYSYDLYNVCSNLKVLLPCFQATWWPHRPEHIHGSQ